MYSRVHGKISNKKRETHPWAPVPCANSHGPPSNYRLRCKQRPLNWNLSVNASATLSSGSEPTSEELGEWIDALFQQTGSKDAVGLLLSPSFSIDAGSLLHQAAVDQGIWVDSFPALVQQEGIWYGPLDADFPLSTDPDDSWFESPVFAITDRHIGWLLGRGKRPQNPEGCGRVDFYTLQAGHTLQNQEKPYCNCRETDDYQPEEKDSLHIHRALVLFPRLGPSAQVST